MIPPTLTNVPELEPTGLRRPLSVDLQLACTGWLVAVVRGMVARLDSDSATPLEQLALGDMDLAWLRGLLVVELNAALTAAIYALHFLDVKVGCSTQAVCQLWAGCVRGVRASLSSLWVAAHFKLLLPLLLQVYSCTDPFDACEICPSSAGPHAGGGEGSGPEVAGWRAAHHDQHRRQLGAERPGLRYGQFGARLLCAFNTLISVTVAPTSRCFVRLDLQSSRRQTSGAWPPACWQPSGAWRHPARQPRWRGCCARRWSAVSRPWLPLTGTAWHVVHRSCHHTSPQSQTSESAVASCLSSLVQDDKPGQA